MAPDDLPSRPQPPLGLTDLPALQDRLLSYADPDAPRRDSLQLMRVAMDRLGNPHRRLPPVVHVAGTNGKGSVIAMVGALLDSRGLRVHTTTSPHLIHLNERILPAGQPIAPDHLARLLDRAEPVFRDLRLGFFHAITALAFLAFAETPADATLVETGIGGLADATNLVPAHVAAVAAIGLDHETLLGDSLAAIAHQKAGIAKPARPFLLGRQAQRDGIAPARSMALARAARLIDLNEAAIWTPLAEALTPVSDGWPPHRLANAALALATVRAGWPDLAFEAASIARLGQVTLAGRGTRLTLADLGGQGDAPVLIDGAHNHQAVTALAEALAADPRPTLAVLAMQATRAPAAVLAPLLPLIDQALCPPLPSGAAPLHPGQLIRWLESTGVTARTEASLSDALATAQTWAADHPDGRIVVAGSLHLAGALLARAQRSAG